MPNLPDVFVTSGQLARVLPTFPGDTNAQKADAYAIWVRDRLRERVIAFEVAAAQEAARAAVEAARASAAENPDNP